MESEEIKDILSLMNDIIDDPTVPKSVKRLVQESKEKLLEEEKDIEVRKSAAIQALENIDDDPNTPMFTRTMIWNLISMLESL